MYILWMEFAEMSFKKNMDVLKDIWDKTGGSMICPQCKGTLTMVQIEPISDTENPYIPYKTVIECASCPEIASWSPSGSRVLSKYEHILNYNLLQELKKSGELVEFLIVNKQVVQVIG